MKKRRKKTVHKHHVHEFLQRVGVWATHVAAEIKLRLCYKMDNQGYVPVKALPGVFASKALMGMFRKHRKAYPHFG